MVTFVVVQKSCVAAFRGGLLCTTCSPALLLSRAVQREGGREVEVKENARVCCPPSMQATSARLVQLRERRF